MSNLQTCRTRHELQQNLEGWASDTEAVMIEEHSQHCATCERTMVDLESEAPSDELLELARASNGDQLTKTPLDPAAIVDPLNSLDPGDESLVQESLVQESLKEIEQWTSSNAPRPAELTPLPRMIDHYELLELIGQGGMAQVYRARHERLQRTVAIKLLNVSPWHVAHSLSRLEREIAVVGQLHHPAIVAATDTGLFEGLPYLVTEYIDGFNLSQLARQHPPRTADACQAIRIAALGLAHAHAQGVTHRDIKPSNLMIDRQGQVKILDFGLVHLDGWQEEAMELTTVGQLVGTLDYMAPEQADKATAVDHRSDIYALGATLFRLLCGRAPYAASLYQSPLEKIRLLAMTKPPRIESLRPDLPAELASVINQCLERDPGNRPPSGVHLAEALEPYCAQADLSLWVEETKVAPPPCRLPSPVASVQPWTGRELEQPPRRNRRDGWFWQWAGLAAFGAAVLLGIVITIETQQGVIVIESDSANIQVSLRQDGKSLEHLELKSGVNQTRVWAGTYEIIVDGQADGFELDQQSVIVKRGQAVLVKVSQRQKAEMPEAEAPVSPFNAATDSLASAAKAKENTVPSVAEETGAVVTKTPKDRDSTTDPSVAATRDQPPVEAVYKGKTYQHWADVFKHERDPEARNQALDALAHFREPEQLKNSRDQFTEILLSIAPGDVDQFIDFAQRAFTIDGLSQENWDRLRVAVVQMQPKQQVVVLRDLSKLVSIDASKTARISVAQYFMYMRVFHYIATLKASTWPRNEVEYLLSNITYMLRCAKSTESADNFRKVLRVAIDEIRLLQLTHDERRAAISLFSPEHENVIVSLFIDGFAHELPDQLQVDYKTFSLLRILHNLAPYATDKEAAFVATKLERYLAAGGLRESAAVDLEAWQVQLKEEIIATRFERLFPEYRLSRLPGDQLREHIASGAWCPEPILPDTPITGPTPGDTKHVRDNFAELVIGTWLIYSEQAGLPVDEQLSRLEHVFATGN
ncbi:MAG: serine/threonine-protein kinase [Pirellulaceae bacterium]|nr:serine/threonine-protein kinase [Pirellulaceae bacterium]